MWQILRQITRTGLVTEAPPQLDDAVLAEARRIRDELLAPDPVAIDTESEELKDGANRCPKCGATDIR